MCTTITRLGFGAAAAIWAMESWKAKPTLLLWAPRTSAREARVELEEWGVFGKEERIERKP